MYPVHSHTLNINNYLKETTCGPSFKDGKIFLKESYSWTALRWDPFLKISIPAAFHKKDNCCKLHFSVPMSAGFHLSLVNDRHWQEGRQWVKGRIQDMCFTLHLSKLVFSATTVFSPSLCLPPEKHSTIPTFPSWFWSLNSWGTASSLCHSGLGVVMVFCFLISESL